MNKHPPHAVAALNEGKCKMSEYRDKTQEEIRFRILRLIEQNPGMSQRELAAEVGISTGGIHYVIKALIEKGLVKLGRFAVAEDKRRYSYVLTPKGLTEKAAITRVFLARKMEEYELLKHELKTLSEVVRRDENLGDVSP